MRMFGNAARITNATEKPSDLPSAHKVEPSRHKRAVKNTQITEKNKTSNKKSGTRRTQQQETLRYLLRKRGFLRTKTKVAKRVTWDPEIPVTNLSSVSTQISSTSPD